MSLSDEERRAIVNYRIEKALVAMEDVTQMAMLQRWSAAANRMYHVCCLLCSHGFVDK